jgi:predicted phosphoribosyltransferase
MASPHGRYQLAPSDPPAFADRTEAGVLLGAMVRAALTVLDAAAGATAAREIPLADPPPVTPPRVLALPRGGVPVAAGVARALNAPLDVLVVRKIGHPAAPELGLGAIAEGGGEPLFDPEMLARAGLGERDLADVVTRERAELGRRAALYHRRPPGGLTGLTVIVVDDGLATGVTARAAVRAVRARGAARALLAVPVAASAAEEAVKDETDELVTVVTPRRFRSVGEWYADFGQLTDTDVLTLLAAFP